MKLLAVLAALAIAVTIPASAQNESAPVKNALVVVTGDPALRPVIDAGGSPSGVRRALETVASLLSSPAHYAPTDEDGEFEFSAPLNSGTYNVTAFAPGYVASTIEASIAPGSAANLTIFMQPSAVVSGRITDEQGSPIPGIVVAAGSPHSANYDVTMGDGVFVLDAGLRTGPHKFYAFKPGIDPAKLNSTELGILPSSTPLFKSDGGYASSVSTVQLEQGKLTTLNIKMKSSHAIEGRITDSAGNPLSDLAVLAFDRNGNMANTMAITNATGHYRLDNDLAAGTYTIVVPSLFSKGYAPASAAVKLPVAGSVDFILDKSSSITGRVVDAAGKPVESAAIFAISKGANDTELAQFLTAGMASALTDSQGRFTLQGGLSKGAYVVTASFGNVPATGSAEIQAGGTAEIKLDFTEAITIKGKVTSAGKPVAGASVLPSAFPGAGLFAARTDNDGYFVLTIPVKDARDRQLFGEIMISAAGYRPMTADVADDRSINVVLDRLPPAKIAGAVVAQQSLSPPVETVLTRKGTLVFDYAGAEFGVGVQTNSRVVDASFDQPAKRVSINLEGVQSSAGRSEFIVPKALLSGPFAVSLDGSLAENVEVVENQTHTTIALEHEHGLQEITIQGTSVVPEFPLPAAVPAIGLAALLVYRRLRR